MSFRFNRIKSIKRYTVKALLVLATIIVIFSFSTISAQYGNNFNLVYNAGNDWNGLKNFDNVFIHTSGIEEGSITIAENRSGPNRKTELLLSFDYDRKGNWSDLNSPRNYELLRKEFLVSYENKRHGSSAGRFYRLSDGISLLPKKNTLFKEGDSTGSFTIDFWIYFYNTYNNQVIFEKKGQIINPRNEPTTSGIGMRLYNNKIEASFKNVFYYLDTFISNSPYSEEEIILKSKETVVPEKWYHISVSFDEYSGLLTLFMNGLLQEHIWCTNDGTSSGEIHVPRFIGEENSPLYIANGINALLDDFHIQRSYTNEFELSKYKKTEGLIESEIVDLKMNGSSIRDVQLEAVKNNNTDAVFEFRISDDYFLPDTDSEKLKWIDFSLVSGIPDEYLYGRYLQWRVRLLPGYLFEYSPLLKSINLDINYNTIPSVVLGVEGESRDGLITLYWDSNIEKDVTSYKIYYGKESKNYIEDGSVITVAKSQLLDPYKPSYTIRGLDKDIVYYFSITAVDSYNNESNFSEEVAVRVKY